METIHEISLSLFGKMREREMIMFFNLFILFFLKLYDETTSYIAAGFFRPEEDPGPDLETSEKWYRDSYRHYERLDAIGMPQVTGVKKITGISSPTFSFFFSQSLHDSLDQLLHSSPILQVTT